MAIRFVSPKSLSVLLLMMSFGVACISTNPATQPMSPDVQSIQTTSSQIIQNCLAVQATVPKNARLSGKLIVNSNYQFSTTSLPGFETEPMPESSHWVSLSPDQKRFVISEMIDPSTSPRLILMNTDEQVVTSFEWEPDWEYALQWVNNNSLLIRTSDVNSLVLLNLASGEKQAIPFPYGDQLYIEYGLAKIRSDFLAFDPNLTKVIYEGEGHVFILRDLDVLPNTVLWAKRNNINWADPVWSPSGDRVAVPLMDEQGIDNLYVVGAFGDSEDQLTDFDALYHHPASTMIYDISWSPNGIYLAIQLDLRVNEQDPPEKIGTRLAGRLLVVNSITQQITDYCLVYAFPPVWSPDGRYLAVDNYVVDLSQQTAYKVTDGYIVGWLADE